MFPDRDEENTMVPGMSLTLRPRVIVLLAAMVVISVTAPLPAASASVSVQESGIWGGGLVNTIAQDPNDARRILIGGDVSGFHASVDYGMTWTTSNKGLTDPQQDTIVSIAYRHLDPPQRRDVFAAFGAAGGGMLLSPNGGGRWLPFGPGAADGGPAFEGHDPCGIGPYSDPCTDPRPTGNLIVLDETSGPPTVLRYVYVGSFGRGLMRTDATGSTWTTIALGSGTTFCSWGNPPQPGCYITSLARDPRRSNVLYVGTHGNGVLKVTGTGCVGDGCAERNVEPILAAPGSEPIVDAEELWFQETTSGTQLMCACGRQGFYKTTFPYTSLSQSNAGLVFDQTPGHETAFSAISGQPANAVSAIYLANVNAMCEIPQGGRNLECHTVYRSLDGGANWEDVAFGGDVQKTVAGTAVDWWEYLCCRDNMLNQESYGASAVMMTGEDPPSVLVAGRSGVWRTTADGDTHWQPAVEGIGSTTNGDVVVDPKEAGQVYVASLDWTLFASASRLDPGTAVQSEPNKVFSNGFAVAVDRQVSDPISLAYLGSGGLDVGVGGVHTSADPTQPGIDPWTSLGFATSGCDRSTPRVIGVGVGRLWSGAVPYTLAATDGCGLWRFDGVTWQDVSAGTDMFSVEDPNMRFAPISYPGNLGRLVFTFDRQTGKLWESNAQGAPGTWVQAWQTTDEIDPGTGFMVADPNVRGVVWLSTSAVDGLHELTCLVPPTLNGCTDLIVPPSNVRNPGPISIRPCTDACTSTVYVATRTVPGDPAPPAMYKHISGGASWCDLTSAAPLYVQAAHAPAQIAASLEVSGVTTIYVSTAGEGVLVVSDDTADCA